VANEQEILAAAKKAILDYDVAKAEEIAKEGLDAGVDPVALVEKGFVPGIVEVGDLFDAGEVYLPELILAADAMKAGTSVCEAKFSKGAIQEKKKVKVIMGTVEGDIHDIGKSIVVAFLAANGFEVTDLGRDVVAETFAEKAKELGADVVGASALLTTTMEVQKKVVEAIKEAGLSVKVIVGGAPTSEEWAQKIGADAYAENATEAVAKIKQLTSLA